MTGQLYENVSPDRTLEDVLRLTDVATFRAEQEAERKRGRYLGLGVSLYMEPTAGPVQISRHNYCQVRIEPSGDIAVLSHAHSQGQGTETTLAQIVAEELGVDYARVRVMQGDSAQGGFGSGAGGSRQAVIAGGAAKLAAQKMKKKVLAIASHMLEAAADDLRIHDGMISVAGVPAMSVSLQKVAQLAYFSPERLPNGMEPALEEQARYAVDNWTWANAAHACVVEVDVDTGTVEILRWMVSEDCGVQINPAVVKGQISGGIAQGIGGVLFEHAPYDEQGNPLAATLKDYLVTTVSAIPCIEFSSICTPSPTFGGYKGAGEGGAIIAPSTLINAIADALAPFDVRCNELPLSPSRIVALLERARIRVGEGFTPSPLTVPDEPN